ncbi:MAG: rhomboid family intramembrane serine protease [Bacteroidota bacterium]
MSGFIENIKYNWKQSGIIIQIILINILLFIPLNISVFLDASLRNYLVLSLDPQEFLFKPWTFITCLFAHEQFMHILSNMLWFYMMARIFVVVTGFTHWTKITFIYIFGGIIGNILLIISSFLLPGLLPKSAYVLGASDGVMALSLALAFFCPDYIVNLIFIGEVKLKWVVAFLFIVSTMVDLSVNTGGKISHFGGSIFGVFYGFQLKKGKDISNWFTNLMKFDFLRRNKLKVIHRKKDLKGVNSKGDEHALNILLDKINRSGYESLSKIEKETLHQLSRKK